jgi:hypothetical protein
MVSLAGRAEFGLREEVNAMSTKRKLEERVTELEDALEEARGLIDDALGEGEGDESGSDQDDE